MRYCQHWSVIRANTAKSFRNSAFDILSIIDWLNAIGQAQLTADIAQITFFFAHSKYADADPSCGDHVNEFFLCFGWRQKWADERTREERYKRRSLGVDCLRAMTATPSTNSICIHVLKPHTLTWILEIKLYINLLSADWRSAFNREDFSFILFTAYSTHVSSCWILCYLWHGDRADQFIGCLSSLFLFLSSCDGNRCSSNLRTQNNSWRSDKVHRYRWQAQRMLNKIDEVCSCIRKITQCGRKWIERRHKSSFIPRRCRFRCLSKRENILAEWGTHNISRSLARFANGFLSRFESKTNR